MAKRDITLFFSLPFPNKRLKIENKEPLDSNNENSKLIRKEVSNSTFLKWKKEHPWLIQEENLMLCTLCKEYAKPEETNFVNGCPALRYETIINSYFDLIVERSKKKEDLPSVYAFNIFFYRNLKVKGYSAIRRWTRKVDIFSFDFNFVPILLTVHCCLAVIDHRSKWICYYDSMGNGEEVCLDILHDYLCQEYKDKKGQILDPSTYVTETMKDIPQQMNGGDCGMFTLKYAEYISRNAEITSDQEHIQYFRRRTVYELLNNQFL